MEDKDEKKEAGLFAKANGSKVLAMLWYLAFIFLLVFVISWAWKKGAGASQS